MGQFINRWRTDFCFSAAIAALGLGACVVAPGTAAAAFPGPDGPLAFTSNRDVGAGDIYSIVPGGSATRLTSSTSSSDPAYSPDGTKIAFVAPVGSSYQIVVMNADGTGRVPITSSPTAKQQPTWSPDGRIAYVANSFDVDGQTDLEIWAVNADGSGSVQLTNNAFPDSEPAWSPDGTRIAFVGTRPGDSNRNVYVMNSDGTGETNLTPNESLPCNGLCYQGHDDSPAWFPDGSRIAYVHTFAENGGGVPNIWAMNPDGTGKDNSTDNEAVSFTSPAPSPQGTRIAAIGTAPQTTDRNLWVMNADGSGQMAIESAPSFESDPDWGVAAPPQAGTPLGVPPPNGFSFGKLKRNKKKGTAKLTVTLPGPGELELNGKLAKPDSESASAAGDAEVDVKPKGKAKTKLAKNGKARLTVAVTFVPTGGSAATQLKKVKLKKSTPGE